MAAAALTRVLKNKVDVTLVESSEIGTVGVGEATIPTLVFFHKLLKLSEQEFMSETNATYKLGINFENWKDLNHSYLHAFGVTGKDCWAAGFQHFWLRGLQEGLSGDFGDYCLERQAAEANKFAHLPNNGLNYAYHIDATSYAKFLRKLSEREGLTRIDAKINNVNLRQQDGFIESLDLDNGQRIEGDFFIDCTGFKGLLIEKAMHTGYEDWSHWLPCDSAVAVQTESTSEPLPYTRCIAHEAGWQWRIPLQHRVGNGMVYCSQYQSDDETIDKLLSNIDGKPLNDPRVIHFRTGRRRKQWNRNCLALGLASGFLEPLESTSIHLIQQGIVRFLRMFPEAGVVQEDINEFNQQADFDIEHIRDFIILHYHVTNRTDTPFWRHCRQMDVPASLRHRIDLFVKTGRIFREGSELFDDSWQQVMIGQGLMPQSYHPIVDTMSRDELEALLTQITSQIRRTVEKLPPHEEYLKRFCQ
ncbi:tryptophan 7-halogenase [Salinimonas iocasae]|uniref:Tryptophan 7-halogenase n=2 Tax=Salinimonas iocasae TaxID=2572577 RepID=A0A5B7YBZ2_9ALTE|nr:tryptophan 7-halogenase [Salinimonas iocasae]